MTYSTERGETEEVGEWTPGEDTEVGPKFCMGLTDQWTCTNRSCAEEAEEVDATDDFMT